MTESNQMTLQKSISVIDLAGFCFMSGDIGGVEPSGHNDPIEAIRIHQRIQRARPKPYYSEVSVTREFSSHGLALTLAGRIDGVFMEGGGTIIEEIKTTARDLNEVAGTRDSMHWGQALCYAAIYASDNDLPHVTVQLTYCHIRSKEEHSVREYWTSQALEEFLRKAMEQYAAMLRQQQDWSDLRNASLEGAAFPFETVRQGQQDIIAVARDAITQGQQALLQAPTGLGKTIASLFGSLEPLRIGTVAKVFFLTARTTGKPAAEQALSLMRQKGCRLRSVTITAKRRICFKPDSACSPDQCEYAKGHYDRVRQAVAEGIGHEDIGAGLIAELAQRHRVCPYELSLDLSLWADVIVCDYNYAFDPRVFLRRFFEERREDYAFLVDEAHNLIDRSRDMFSGQIQKRSVMELRRKLPQSAQKLRSALNGVNTSLLEVGRRVAEAGHVFVIEEEPDKVLAKKLAKLQEELRGWLEATPRSPMRKDAIDLVVEVNVLLDVIERFNETHACIAEVTPGNVRYKLFCIDPSQRMAEAWSRASSAVLFSATLEPFDYFRGVLGIKPETSQLALPSPFPRENLGVIISRDISTLYKRRHATKHEVALRLAGFVSLRPGNYIAYFPSYEYLGMVLDEFTALAPDVATLVQTADLSEAGRQRFIERFAGQREGTLLAFAVLGGVFGEAIDLPGEQLIGVAIVGVGLPGLSPERELIRSYYQEREESGFEFAFVYPGITRVLQAAGRVVRTDTDRGLVLLLDQRFLLEQYHSLLPKHWRISEAAFGKQLFEQVKCFWAAGDSKMSRP